jgi:hypothetical protein
MLCPPSQYNRSFLHYTTKAVQTQLFFADGEIRPAAPLAGTHAGIETVPRTVSLASLLPCSNLTLCRKRKTPSSEGVFLFED